MKGHKRNALGGFERLSEHADLSSKATRKALIARAKELLLKDGVLRDAEDERTLFMAMLACAHEYERAVESSGLKSGVARRSRILHQQILDHLVKANVGLVYEMRRVSGLREGDEDEFASEGMWSLVQAVLAFDPWRGYRFSTYACNAILRGYRHVWKRSMRRRSLMATVAHRRELENDALVPENQSTALFRERLVHLMKTNSANLTPIEQLIIERRFLIPESDRRHTLEGIGKMIRLSKERVRQIQVGALAKLREALTADPVLH